MNHEYISLLSELGDLMNRRGEMFRAKAYHKASDSIAVYPHAVKNVSELKDIKGVGKTVLAKLQEYSDTGKIELLEQERANPLHLLTTVYGIGPKKAKTLIDQNLTTIDDLRANTHLLTSASQAGLRHYDDIEKRIPRSEIDEYNYLLHQILPGVRQRDREGYRERERESERETDRQADTHTHRHTRTHTDK